MSWQEEDGDGNRQGLTISEYGELGGPGMGGCPAAPATSAPRSPAPSVVRSTDKTSLSVTWRHGVRPGAGAVTGYNVEAVQQYRVGDRWRVCSRQAHRGRGHPRQHRRPECRRGLRRRGPRDLRAQDSEAYTVQVPARPSPTATRSAPALTASPGHTAAVNVTSEITLTERGRRRTSTTPSTGPPRWRATCQRRGAALHRADRDLPGDHAQRCRLRPCQAISLFSAAYKPPVDTTPVPSAITSITGTARQAAVTLNWTSTETAHRLRRAGLRRRRQGGRAEGDDRQDADDQQPDPRRRVLLHRQGEEQGRLRARVDSLRAACPDQGDRHGQHLERHVEERWFPDLGQWLARGRDHDRPPATSTGAIDRTRSLGSAQSIPAAAPATGSRGRSACGTPTPPRRTPAGCSSSPTAVGLPSPDRSWSRTGEPERKIVQKDRGALARATGPSRVPGPLDQDRWAPPAATPRTGR